MNPFYNPTGYPVTGSAGTSAPARSEFSSIAAGFDKMPALTANTAVVVNASGTALTNTVGGLALGGDFSTSGGLSFTGAYSTVFVQQANVTITLPAANTALIGATTADVLTRKTINGPDNTLTNIANAALANSAITIAGTSVSLGGAITSTAILDAIGTTQGMLLYRGASAWGTLALGTTGQLLRAGASGPAWSTATYPATAGSTGNVLTSDGTNVVFAAPFSYSIMGLTLSTAGGSATFGIASGKAVDGAATALMSLSSAYTKTTGAWTVGTGNGALDTGTIAASTWYHVWLIQRPDTGVVDVLISASATSPTMPANYTLKRRIGAMLTDSTVSPNCKWVAFYQFGDKFYFVTPITNYSDVSAVSGEVLRTVSVPSGIAVEAIISVLVRWVSSGGQWAWIYSPSSQVNIVSSWGIYVDNGVSTAGNAAQVSNVVTDTSSRVVINNSQTAHSTYNIGTIGWIDPRGQW